MVVASINRNKVFRSYLLASLGFQISLTHGLTRLMVNMDLRKRDSMF